MKQFNNHFNNRIAREMAHVPNEVLKRLKRINPMASQMNKMQKMMKDIKPTFGNNTPIKRMQKIAQHQQELIPNNSVIRSLEAMNRRASLFSPLNNEDLQRIRPLFIGHDPSFTAEMKVFRHITGINPSISKQVAELSQRLSKLNPLQFEKVTRQNTFQNKDFEKYFNQSKDLNSNSQTVDSSNSLKNSDDETSTISNENWEEVRTNLIICILIVIFTFARADPQGVVPYINNFSHSIKTVRVLPSHKVFDKTHNKTKNSEEKFFKNVHLNQK